MRASPRAFDLVRESRENFSKEVTTEVWSEEEELTRWWEEGRVFQQKGHMQRPRGSKGHGKYMHLNGGQCPRIAKATWRRETKLDAKSFNETIVIKGLWCQHEDKQIDQRNRGESLETDRHIQDYHISDKDDTVVQWERDSLFSKWCWANSMSIWEKVYLGSSLTLYTKINSRQFAELNVKVKTIQLLEEHLGIGKYILNRTQKA